MNVEDAAAAVAYLSAMTSGWSDDATEALVYEFERLEDPVALGEAVGKVARSWTWGGRPPLGVLMDAYHHEVALSEGKHRAQVEARAVRCDGSGWFDSDGDLTPCSTCNVALWRVWNEPGGRLRWRHGVPTWRVLGFDAPAECEKELSRERCPSALDVEHERCDVGVGMRAALDSYRAEYGRDPSTGQAAWLRAAARSRRVDPDDF